MSMFNCWWCRTNGGNLFSLNTLISLVPCFINLLWIALWYMKAWQPIKTRNRHIPRFTDQVLNSFYESICNYSVILCYTCVMFCVYFFVVARKCVTNVFKCATVFTRCCSKVFEIISPMFWGCKHWHLLRTARTLNDRTAINMINTLIPTST